MYMHMAHPSVRMKGTEIDWTPMHCMDSECTHTMKGPHLHCPFCTLESIFTDQVILKAHYRVKHVDKAIEFAGLNILRCCRMCDVHGIIHEWKHLKGAHWHCYHCHNGFNRRDEAMKHFRQHFRNPQTTLQIVIAQDVNQTMATYTNPVPSSTSLEPHLIVQSQESIDGRQAGSDMSPCYKENGRQRVEYECVGCNDQSQSSDDREETIVLIEIPDNGSGNKEGMESDTCFTEHSASINLTLLQEKERLEKQLLEERSKWAKTEQKLKGTIERLRAKVEYLSNTNAALKQQLTAMHTSSLKRLTNDYDHQSILQELVQHMSEEHTQLLHHHLAQLRLFAEARELSTAAARAEESSTDRALVPADLGCDQSQDIQGMMIMNSDSVNALENMEQTVVMTITSEDAIAESQEENAEDKDPLQKDVQMTSSGAKDSYQLSSNGNTSDSALSYQSDHSNSTHDGTPQDFDKHKGLKFILSDGNTAKVFRTASLEKRTFEDDISSEEPQLKRGRTKIFKVS